MPWCAVFECRESKNLHQFPDSGKKALQNKWLEKINRANYTITRDSRVCEKHFEDSAFIPTSENKDSRGRPRQRRTLKENAYPSLLLRPEAGPSTHSRKRKNLNEVETISMIDVKKFRDQKTKLSEHNYFGNELVQNENDIQDEDIPMDIDSVSSFVASTGNDNLPKQNDPKYFDVGSEVEIEQNEKDYLLSIIKKQREEIENKERQRNELSSQMTAVKKFLNPDQIRRLTLSETTTAPWSDETLEKSIRTYAKMHGSGYNYLRKHVLTKNLLPSKRTLQRKLSQISVEGGGIVTDFLKLMAIKVETMKEQAKCCILNLDEMAITAAYVYNAHSQSYCGTITVPLAKNEIKKKIKVNGKYEEEKELAYHAMSIILVGMSALENGKPWKQFIGCQFTGHSFDSKFIANWLVQVIEKVTEVGLNVKGVTMDNCPANVAV